MNLVLVEVVKNTKNVMEKINIKGLVSELRTII